MKFPKSLCIYIAVSTLLLASCKKDALLTNSTAKLDFSTDSVLFDTVFTTIGSTTKVFKIYNRHNQKMNITRAYLGTGTFSQFRINVDGISGSSISDIEILANDSLFVFVQVTVNPTGVNSPLLIKDSIVFETNGNLQDIKLTAIGQDVHLHKPNKFPTNGIPPYSIISCTVPWTNDKPHLIFGYAVVDSACTLTMNPGTHVYLNTGAVLWIYKDGTLKVNGAKGNEVIFEGARLESIYKEIPGQWGKIWMMQGSKDNVIDWAIIKNGSIALQTDSLGVADVPLLNLTNTIIKNMASAAIYAKGSHIRSSNCVFANCGQYVAAISKGGKYRFDHCTFANYWDQSQRATPSIYLSNYYIQGNVYYIRNLDSAYFGNCIIYGNINEEIVLDPSGQGGLFSYKFENCLLKTGLNTSAISHYLNIYANRYPDFKDITANNYQLNAASPAIDKGYTNPFIFDLENQPRPNPSTSLTDIGAYEFYP